jgi:hypothetical protein
LIAGVSKFGLTATHFPAQRARALLTMIALFAAPMPARMEVFAADPNSVFDTCSSTKRLMVDATDKSATA